MQLAAPGRVGLGEFGKDEVAFARVRRAAARREARPYVFVSVPGEPKPLFVDPACAVRAAVLAATVREQDSE